MSANKIYRYKYIRKCDIEGRILKLRAHADYRPKSGKSEEIAVIPQTIACRPEKGYIIPVTEIAISKAIASHGKQAGLNLNPHKLRKWCTSYWERKNEPGMVNFVLRHSAVNLKDRYIAPLSIEEVMEKQEIIEGELFF